jgi:hypothetical protein
VTPPTLEQRIPNDRRTPRLQREYCRWCGDSGYVVVRTRADISTRQVRIGTGWQSKTVRAEHDEYGPCPYCRRGFYEEYGDPEHQQNQPPVEPPWGPEGFWRGRELPELQPLGSLASERVPIPEEARAWLKSIGASIKEAA